MHYGVTLPGSGGLARPEVLSGLAQDAEALGFSSVWAADHVALPVAVSSQYPYNSTGAVPWSNGEPWLAPLLTLAWLGAQTESIQLGVSIFVLPLRHAVVVAKDVATAAVLTGGRIIFGVGCGWMREEFQLLERPFDRRRELTQEGVEVLKACWRTEPVEFQGTFHKLPPFSMMPKPGAIPIWGGGSSESALRTVSASCDGWHPSNLSPDEWAAKARRLAELLNEDGRDPGSVTLTARPGRSRPVNRDLADAYADAGAEMVLCDVEYRDMPTLDVAAERLRELASELKLTPRLGA